MNSWVTSILFAGVGRLKAFGSQTAAELIVALPMTCSLAALLICLALTAHYLIQGAAPMAPFSRGATFVVSAAVAFGSGLVALVMRRVHLSRPAPRSAFLRSALLGLHSGLLLLWIPALLLVWTFPGEMSGGWTYKLLNKRWLNACYLLSIVTTLVLPVAWARFMAFGSSEVPSAPQVRPTGSLAFRTARRALAIAGLLSAVWYIQGGPWHMDLHHRGIDFHEQVHLGPLQAIAKGYLPFVGPASTQYGAGSQILTYGLMKLAGSFDVPAYRTAQAALQLGASVIFVLVCYLLFGFWRALAAFVLALPGSPLSFLYPSGDGTLEGDYGWGNAWRYLGTFSIVTLLPLAAFSDRRSRAWVISAALGIAWGVFAWIAQENLSSTLIAASLLLALLWLSSTCSLQRVLDASIGLVAGGALVWAVVLGYYAMHGAAGAYFDNYFLVAGAIAKGFQNTWWEPGPLRAAYLWTAPFTLAIGVMTLWHVGSGRLRPGLTAIQARTLAIVCAFLACYQTVLFRSDTSHLRNTFIALPILEVLILVDLPRWTSGVVSRWGLRAALAAVVLWLYPFNLRLAEPVTNFLQPPLKRFASLTPPSVADDSRVPFRRAGRFLSDEPIVAAVGPPMREFLEFADRLRTTVGDRRVYISQSLIVSSSLYYFLADLTPAPFIGDREIMQINNARLALARSGMRAHIAEFECLLTVDPNSEEAQIFREAYPAARVERLELSGHDFFAFFSDRHQP